MAYNPPIGSIYHLYTTYILPSRGLYNPYHLLGEPETTIERAGKFGSFFGWRGFNRFFSGRCGPQFFFAMQHVNWAVLSDEQTSNGYPFFLLNDEQMSNKVGVEHQPVNLVT